MTLSTFFLETYFWSTAGSHFINKKTRIKSDDYLFSSNNKSLSCLYFQDVIGKALPKIGSYGALNNTQQVVALINDVSMKVLRLIVAAVTSHRLTTADIVAERQTNRQTDGRLMEYTDSVGVLKTRR